MDKSKFLYFLNMAMAFVFVLVLISVGLIFFEVDVNFNLWDFHKIAGFTFIFLILLHFFLHLKWISAMTKLVFGKK